MIRNKKTKSNLNRYLLKIANFFHGDDCLIDFIDKDSMLIKFDKGDIPYSVAINYLHESSIIQINININLRVAANKEQKIRHLITLINEKLLIGRFDINSEQKNIAYKNALIIEKDINLEQASVTLDYAFTYLSLYLPAFTAVVWNDKIDIYTALMHSTGENIFVA